MLWIMPPVICPPDLVVLRGLLPTHYDSDITRAFRLCYTFLNNFSFQTSDDSALTSARQITGPHDYRVIVNPVIDRYSGKMSNLRHGLQAATHEFILFSDGDIVERAEQAEDAVED